MARYPSLTSLSLVYLSLMVLLAVAVAATSLVASIGISLIKTALIALFFMNLYNEERLIRTFAGAGFLWLSLLLGILLNDVLFRRPTF